MTDRTHRHARIIAILFAAGAALPALAQTPPQTLPSGLDGIYACADKADPVERLACFDAAVAGLKTAEASGDLVTVTREEVKAVERDAFGFNLPSLPRLGSIFGGGKKSAKAREADLRPKGNPLTAPVVAAPVVAAPVVTAPSVEPQPTVNPGSAVKMAEVQTPDAPVRPPAFEEIKSIVEPLRATKEFGYDKTRFLLANGQVWDQVDTTKVRIPRERDGQTNTVEIRKGAAGSFLLRVNGKGSAIRVRRRR